LPSISCCELACCSLTCHHKTRGYLTEVLGIAHELLRLQPELCKCSRPAMSKPCYEPTMTIGSLNNSNCLSAAVAASRLTQGRRCGDALLLDDLRSTRSPDQPLAGCGGVHWAEVGPRHVARPGTWAAYGPTGLWDGLGQMSAIVRPGRCWRCHCGLLRGMSGACPLPIFGLSSWLFSLRLV
jgi:hypothetical protein